MDADDRTALLEELPGEVANRLIALLDPSERRVTQAILGYPEESIGRLMTPDYVRVKPEWTIGEAMDHIRRYGRDAETVNVIYVVDAGQDDRRSPYRQCLLAIPRRRRLVMDRNTVARRDRRRRRRTQMQRYDRVALPVDSQGVLVGIGTADDVADFPRRGDRGLRNGRNGGAARRNSKPLLPLMAALGWLSFMFIGDLTFVAMTIRDEIRRAVVCPGSHARHIERRKSDRGAS